MNTNLVTIGTIAEALPAPITFNAAIVAAELVRFAGDADKAEGIAERAVIEDEDSLGRGADVVKSITAVLKDLDAARMAQTKPLDTAKDKLMAFYGASRTRLMAAKTLLSTKMQTWQRAEQVRLEAAAAVARKAQEEEARKLAAAQAALGDAEGAEQILADAAAIKQAPVKATATGVYGASAGTTKRPVGKITNLRQFLAWAAKNGSSELLDAVTVGQAALNRLAASTLAAAEACPETAQIPGFEATRYESLTIK